MDAAVNVKTLLPEEEPLAFVVETFVMRFARLTPVSPTALPAVDAALVTLATWPTSFRSTSVKLTVTSVVMSDVSTVSAIVSEAPLAITGASLVPVIRNVMSCVVVAFAVPLPSLTVTV